jgi:hypothetical protein
MRDGLKALCLILAMANLVIWSAVYGNIVHKPQQLPSVTKSQQFGNQYHAQPTWI